MDADLETWIFAHSYLAPMAAFREEVAAALAASGAAAVAPPRLDAYAADHRRGVPLLASAAAAVDLAPAGALLERLVAALSRGDVPPKLAEDLRQLQPGGGGPAGAAVISWLTGRGEAPPSHAGLWRFLGWSALSRALRPALDAFEAWRDDAAWQRPECPACGAAPAMAQLPGGAGGLARRRLACGCCATRWGFARLGCPYCGNAEPDRLGALEIEEEPELRIDTCGACTGYLKTYVGEGREGLLLGDWTTLHLDLLARERGFERRGASLYDL
jgi:FdhE protein